MYAFIVFGDVSRVSTKALHLLGRHFTLEPCSQPFLLYLFLDRVSCFCPEPASDCDLPAYAVYTFLITGIKELCHNTWLIG
jgi:hypothetical protein